MMKELTIRLVLVIALFAVLTFSGRKGWLKANELLWIGGAMIFWAVGILLQVVVPIILPKFPGKFKALLISVGLVSPLVIALIVSLRYLFKKVREKETGNG